MTPQEKYDMLKNIIENTTNDYQLYYLREVQRQVAIECLNDDIMKAIEPISDALVTLVKWIKEALIFGKNKK